MKSIYFKIYIFVHKNLFEPQAPDHLEKLTKSLIYNFHHQKHFAKIKDKKVIPKIKIKKLFSWSLVCGTVLLECKTEKWNSQCEHRQPMEQTRGLFRMCNSGVARCQCHFWRMNSMFEAYCTGSEVGSCQSNLWLS